MEKFDIIPEPEDAPVRGDYPRIGNSKYRFNVWYKFPKMIKKQKDKPGYDNYDGDHNFESDDLIDYMRESMTGIKLIEDFDEREDYFTGKVWKRYRVEAFIPERDCGIDGVYSQDGMKLFNEIDFDKSGEWIAKMLDRAGAVLDVKKCRDRIKRQELEAKELMRSIEDLSAIVDEAINSDKLNDRDKSKRGKKK